jgi:dipeptidyl-peptidase-3
MRNRALIANWALDCDINRQENVVEIVEVKGKHYIRINDYARLRDIFAMQLAEIQRIKSEGDYERARQLVEKYAVKLDRKLHEEILNRYAKLNIAPYKGFINRWMKPVIGKDGEIEDVKVDYTETYEHQMRRYSEEYATLI